MHSRTFFSDVNDIEFRTALMCVSLWRWCGIYPRCFCYFHSFGLYLVSYYFIVFIITNNHVVVVHTCVDVTPLIPINMTISITIRTVQSCTDLRKEKKWYVLGIYQKGFSILVLLYVSMKYTEVNSIQYNISTVYLISIWNRWTSVLHLKDTCGNSLYSLTLQRGDI